MKYLTWKQLQQLDKTTQVKSTTGPVKVLDLIEYLKNPHFTTDNERDDYLQARGITS